MFKKITIVLLAVATNAQSPSALAQNACRARRLMGIGDRDAPGIRRHIRASDLLAPYASPSRANHVAIVERSANAQLKVPPCFDVKLFASGLNQPRLIRVAPNGDIFIAESVVGRIRVLRPSDGGDKVSRNEVFASGLKLPFGIAFYPRSGDPQWVYVANTDTVVRFPYRNGDLRATGKAEIIVSSLPTGDGHWTRDIAFSEDDSKMFISVSSASNCRRINRHVRRCVPESMDRDRASVDNEDPIRHSFGRRDRACRGARL
jgi:glucose/arabinose dehydrogenase